MGLALMLLLLGGARSARGSKDATGAFPQLEASARGAALGGNLCAMAEGGEALLYNPAGLLSPSGREISFSYADLFNLGLVTHSAVLFDWPILGREILWEEGKIRRVPTPPPARYALGLGLTDLRGDLGNEDNYSEMQLAAGLAWRMPLRLRVGLTYRYLGAQSNLSYTGGHGWAVDLGWLRSLGGFTLGFTAINAVSYSHWTPDASISRSESEESHPLAQRWSLGLAYTPKTFPLTVTCQNQWADARFTWLSAGAGLEWRGPLTLRAGVRRREDVLGGRFDWSAGAGFKVKGLHLDYGWLGSGHDLGATHRWSASLGL